jgi:hypothetical protein
MRNGQFEPGRRAYQFPGWFLPTDGLFSSTNLWGRWISPAKQPNSKLMRNQALDPLIFLL